jgi:hypothetical protein
MRFDPLTVHFRPLGAGLLVGLAALVLAAAASLAAGPGGQGAVPMAASSGRRAASVCAPRLQLRFPSLCSGLGPAAGLSTLARQGLYPEMPLATEALDPSLSHVPYNYIRLSGKKDTLLYNSAKDARDEKHSSQSIEAGFDYASWTDCSVENRRAVYMIGSGVYMRGGDSCSQIAMPSFEGLAFSRTPSRPFAWILGTVHPNTLPGDNQPASGQTLYRFAVVQIYGDRQVEGKTWYQIGASAWVTEDKLAMVTPDPARPPGVKDDRWISINLYEQTLAVYENGQLVFATMVASGLPGWWTQPGTFQVYSKLKHDDMTGSFAADRSDYYYLQDVPWVLYFDKARALHGAYWHNGYGYPRSHGCVNMSPSDAHWLYDWADVGTYVYVWDPTGRTPTDAELYSAGGA